jgi:hypothetical protein
VRWKRKDQLGLQYLGCIIIINSAIAFLPLLQKIPTNVQKFAIIFAVSPDELISYIGLLFKCHIAISALFSYLFWLLGVLWGIGILRLNNISRIIVIGISILEISGIVFSGHLDYRGYGEPVYLYGPKLWFVFSVATFCVHIAYIYYLTRPKIKEQFK